MSVLEGYIGNTFVILEDEVDRWQVVQGAIITNSKRSESVQDNGKSADGLPSPILQRCFHPNWPWPRELLEIGPCTIGLVVASFRMRSASHMERSRGNLLFSVEIGCWAGCVAFPSERPSICSRPTNVPAGFAPCRDRGGEL